MKRFAFFAVFLIAFAFAVSAAAPLQRAASTGTSDKAFDNGTMVAQVGIGYGVESMYGDMVVPPISAAFEYGVKFAPMVPISFGGLIGYASSEQKYDYGPGNNWKWTYDYYIIGARAAYHFTELIQVKHLDLYAGVMLGYNVVKVSTSGTASPGYSASGDYVLYGVYAGVRYYFTDHLGAWSEVGYGVGYINVGVCYKI